MPPEGPDVVLGPGSGLDRPTHDRRPLRGGSGAGGAALVGNGGPAMVMTATQQRLRLGESVLSFPLTAFTPDGALDVPGFQQHIGDQISHSPGAIFVCCGTGEFAALTPREHAVLVAAAVEVSEGRVSVVAGVGIGAELARDQARAAEVAGADGLLLLPPYLATGPQAGLEAYARAAAGGTELPVVLYQRGLARYEPQTVARLRSLPQLARLKDGLGDLEHMNRIRLTAGDDLLYFNGMPTAELQADAYRAIGAPRYSSAVFAMAPEISSAFYRAWQGEDRQAVDALLRDFYRPLAQLRDRVPGYAVSLIKAGARLRGTPVGSVRAPLTDPGQDDVVALRGLLDVGVDLARRVP